MSEETAPSNGADSAPPKPRPPRRANLQSRLAAAAAAFHPEGAQPLPPSEAVHMTATPPERDPDRLDHQPPTELPSAAPFMSGDLPPVGDMPRASAASQSMLRSLEATREFEARVKYEDTVAELLADLDFEAVPYQIDLVRKDPEYHPDGTFIGLGYAHTFTELVTLKQIAERFGGGKYQLTVRVPTAPGSQKYRFYSSAIINISGEPVIPPSRIKKVADTAGAASTAALRELMTKQIEIADAQLRDAKAEAKEMIANFQKANNPDLMLEMMREERKMQEQRLQAEREERTREREEERRRQEVQLEQARLHHEKQLETLRLEAKERADIALRQAEQARQDAARLAVDQPKSMETMLMFMQKMDAEKQVNAQKQSEFMMQMMQQSAQNNAANMQAAQNMQLTVLSEALKEAKGKKSDVLEMVTEFKTLKSVFGGGDDGVGAPAGPTWQDLVKEGMNKLPDVINAIRPTPAGGAASGGAGGASAQPAAPKTVGPGAAAVLENPPNKKPRRLTDGGAPGAAALPPGAPAAAKLPDNTLADFEFASEEHAPEAALIMLVKTLDLGLQRGLSSRSLYDQIVLKYPTQIQSILRLSTVSQIHETVSSKAPAHWSINSPRGKRAMEEMHGLLVAGAAT